MSALRVLGYSLRDVWNELFLMVGLSLLWWLAVISIIGGPPATAALSLIGYRLAQEKRVNLDFAREAFKDSFWPSWRLGVVGLVGTAVIASNILFYARADGWLQAVILPIIYLSMAWLVVLLYAFPLLIAMDNPSVRHALRNAAVLTFANPVFNLILFLGLILLTAISTALPVLLLLLLPSIVSLVGARALADRIDASRARQARA